MNEVKKRLGRGLDSLLSSTRIQEIENASAYNKTTYEPIGDAASRFDAVIELPVGKVTSNPHQPRKKWNETELMELSESIKANGIIQPILVRPMGANYQLIAGERRLRAAIQAQKNTIPAIVRHASEEQMLEWALIENIHRADLNAIERARAYKSYVATFSLSQQEVAQRLGEDRSTIANYMRLLELPPELQQMVADGSLSMGHARALLGIKEPARQKELAAQVREKNLSVRKLERLVQILQQAPAPSSGKPQKSPHIQELEHDMTRILGTRVTIHTARRTAHRGKIIIEFYNLDDFDRIREKLQ